MRAAYNPSPPIGEQNRRTIRRHDPKRHASPACHHRICLRPPPKFPWRVDKLNPAPVNLPDPDKVLHGNAQALRHQCTVLSHILQ
jgi:hypothetical protein